MPFWALRLGRLERNFSTWSNLDCAVWARPRRCQGGVCRSASTESGEPPRLAKRHIYPDSPNAKPAGSAHDPARFTGPRSPLERLQSVFANLSGNTWLWRSCLPSRLFRAASIFTGVFRIRTAISRMRSRPRAAFSFFV